ncbi:Hypothetical predicted protein [Paramuricea clavata]|uniref:Uncharacterized protein n=1 Tax=Paramuricea clavata TaxID=317549 RepID=A0A7D9H8R8_PARCT|nr:Hypothetical predicted protein [Paramuricea clavata]
MSVASTSMPDKSRVESISTSVNPEFGLYADDPGFDSDTSSCAHGSNSTSCTDSWLGVLHQIAGKHEWVDGECEHEPLVATEVDKAHLNKNSKDFETLRKVILATKFLKSLPKYVTFRHTSKLEKFNSMLLKYARKRVGFQKGVPDTFNTMRKKVVKLCSGKEEEEDQWYDSRENFSDEDEE